MPEEQVAFVVRVLAVLPLLYITGQMIALQNLLRTRAWSLLALGFVVFLSLRIAVVFVSPPTIPYVLVTLGGYVFIALGLRTLRIELKRVLTESFRRAQR